MTAADERAEQSTLTDVPRAKKKKTYVLLWGGPSGQTHEQAPEWDLRLPIVNQSLSKIGALMLKKKKIVIGALSFGIWIRILNRLKSCRVIAFIKGWVV